MFGPPVPHSFRILVSAIIIKDGVNYHVTAVHPVLMPVFREQSDRREEVNLNSFPAGIEIKKPPLIYLIDKLTNRQFLVDTGATLSLFHIWTEAVPLSATNTKDCVDALMFHWIARFGVPSVLTSDRGTQFTSSVWTELSRRLGIRHSTTTAYHPQANGMIERYHRQLKDALRSRLAGYDWFHHLPWVLLGIRSAPKEDSTISSAELLYGTPLTLPGQFLESGEPEESFQQDSKFRMKKHSLPPSNHHKTVPPPVFTPETLNKVDFVFVRRDGYVPPLTPLYEGPYRVLERSDKYFRLEIGSNIDTVSIDRLKPYNTWKIANLESCHSGKYLWEVVTCKKSLGKEPNIN